ncbi:MAG TPA: tetratricopeptide repeat protein [candidate division WOR-3 bacterium]|uniref:Tetratricopeptide repeat protein n=1 Tax=candidate division WOR-3 bacterium TaxID=2052148 RepID=A0A7V0T6B1_UNCW3|nr:tetratricopeptide repeat protein [candidate division WOR-3 bacterium]
MTWLLLLPALLAGALSPAQTRQLVERYNRAQVFVAERDHSRALAELQSLVRDYGNSEYADELRFALAEAHFNAGSFERSRGLFRQILESARHDYIRPEAMLGEALSSIMLGQYARARLALEAISKEGGYDRDERTNFAFGVLHYFLGEYEQAVTRLAGLEMPEAKFYLAKCRSVTGNPVAALLLFNEIVAEVPNTPIATMAHFAAGEALFANRDYDGARAKLQFFVDEFPQSRLADYAHYYLGCALLAQRRDAQAISHLMPLTRHSNNYLAAHANYFLGHAHMALGQPTDAIERYQRVRANYPNTRIAGFANLQLAQAMLATADTSQTLLATSQLTQMFRTGDLSGVGNYLSGVILYQTGKYADAARQFDDILSRYPETSLREPAAGMLLLALSSAGRHEQAVALGAKYLADFPEEGSEWRARTLYFLAEALYHYGKYSEADAHYQRSYTHSASSDIAPYARLGRNYCLYHLGRLGEADAGFRALLTAKPDDTLFTVFAYLGHGYSLFNQREYTQALDIFEALANTFPDNPLAAIPGHFYAGYSYYQLGYYGQSIDAWTTLINRFPERNPKVAEAAFRTGDTYFKALEYDKAVASFTFVVERHPTSDFAAPSQALIAQCYYNRSQYLDAVREYQKFLDLYSSDPQAPSVRKSLEMAYYLAGTEDTVVMHDFLRRYPRSDMAAEGQFDRGKALFDQGRYSEAAFELQKVVVNFPGSPLAGDAQLLTAESYAQKGEWGDAANAYRKFLEYFPEHQQTAGARFNLGTAYFNAGEYQRSLESFQAVANEHPDSEYVESARQNIAISRQRLGAGGAPADAETPVSSPEGEEQP